MGNSGWQVNHQFHAPTTLLLGKNPWNLLNRRLGGPQNQSGYTDASVQVSLGCDGLENWTREIQQQLCDLGWLKLNLEWREMDQGTLNQDSGGVHIGFRGVSCNCVSSRYKMTPFFPRKRTQIQQEKQRTRRNRHWHFMSWILVWTTLSANTVSHWKNMPTSWFLFLVETMAPVESSFAQKTIWRIRTWGISMISGAPFLEGG
jgi:hypothetical protein